MSSSNKSSTKGSSQSNKGSSQSNKGSSQSTKGSSQSTKGSSQSSKGSSQSNKAIRPSPTQSATLFKVNTVKIGNDGYKYIVQLSKNGIKKWIKIKYFDSKKFLTKAFKELEQNGIIAFSSPVVGMYRDEVHAFIEEKILSHNKYNRYVKKYWSIDTLDKKTIDSVPFIYHIGDRQEPPELYLSYNLVKGRQMEIVDRILKKHFKKNYKWNKNPNIAIMIKTGVKIHNITPSSNKEDDYGAKWGIKTQTLLKQWRIEYPHAKFIMKENQERWSSPKIEQYIKEYKILKRGLDKLKCDDFDDTVFPLTPWVSPIQAEQDTKDGLDSMKSYVMYVAKKGHC